MKSMSCHKTESQLFKSYSTWGGSGENNSSHGSFKNDWLYSGLLLDWRTMSRICYLFEKLKRVFASIKNSKILLFKTIFPLKLFPVVCCYGNQLNCNERWYHLILSQQSDAVGDAGWWRRFQMYIGNPSISSLACNGLKTATAKLLSVPLRCKGRVGA